MSNIFVEVDEAMKQERLEKLWQQYGGFFLGFLAIIILGTAANAGYSSWNNTKNIKQTDIFINATSVKNHNAQDLIKISDALSSNLQDINNINAAGLLVNNGEINEAVKIYEIVANNKGKHSAINEMAAYLSTNISQDITTEEKLSKLNDIVTNDTNSWRYHAALDAALIEANMTQNYTRARSHLDMIIKSNTAPKTLKQKAQSLDILYALKEKVGD